MAQSKSERLGKVYEGALSEFNRIQSAMYMERLQCLQDRRFYSIAGAQWEGPLEQQFENKTKIEVNKIHLSIIRIFNEYRHNRLDVKFISKDGEERQDLAETCQMLYRADEQDSVAEEAYDNAFEEAVGGGIGAWRLRTEYEDDADEDSDVQRIRIEPIFDADTSVYFDMDAKRQDKSDAKRCYVIYSVPVEDYIETYGDDPASWPKDTPLIGFNWCTPDVVYVAEYYAIELKKETLHVYRSLTGEERRILDSELADDVELEHFLEVTGFTEVRQKKITKRKVHKYLMSGSGILEDCGYIAGQNIPIVPVYGKRWVIDNVERCMGHVRLAKDAQRLKNMQLSKLAELSAKSSIEKPILTPEQILGHQTMWSEDPVKDWPYLLVNPIQDASGNTTIIGPASYTKSANLPPSMAALLQVTEQDMRDILGNQEQGEALPGNISGKAVELIQTRIDMQSYIYISNFAKAIKRSGEIWLSMAKDIFIEEGRKMKGISEAGKASSITLLSPIMKADGETGYENDLNEAKFDVAVEVGPSSESKRQATVRALTGMMSITQDPETLQVLSSMAMMNMDGEGIEDVRDFFRKKLVRMGVVKPTDEEAEQLQQEAQMAQQQPPDANTQFLMASAQEAEAKAAGARANTVYTIARAKETEAKTAATLSEIGLKERDQVLSTLRDLRDASSGEMPSIPQ